MKKLINFLGRLDVSIDEEQLSKLNQYMEGILLWNEKINLTAIKDREQFIVKHYMDSLALLGDKTFHEAECIIDVGTGGGFPGVPLAIMCPEKKFFLADSLKKRLNVIEQLCGEIGIGNCVTVHGRAEDLGHDLNYREVYDLAISRAVASMPVLMEYLLPLVKKDGFAVAFKGPDYEEELEKSRRALAILGGKNDHVFKFQLEESQRNIGFIKKENTTPKKYPRKAGTPVKQPL